MRLIAEKRKAKGLPPFPIRPDAYDAADGGESPAAPPALPPDAGSENPLCVVLRFLQYGANRSPSQADYHQVGAWLAHGVPPIPIRLVLADEYKRARSKRGPDADLSHLRLFDAAVRRAWLWRFKTGLSATGYPAVAGESPDETSDDSQTGYRKARA
jgi:hypothetical protein